LKLERMKLQTLKPVAFIGSEASQTIHHLYTLEQRFLPIEAPSHAKLERVVQGLEPLGFLGAVFTSPSSVALALVDRREHSAERDGVVDAVSVTNGSIGAHTLEDALIRALEFRRYNAHGAHAVILGGGAVSSAALQLARVGLKTLTIAAPDRPAAEFLARKVPAGVTAHAISLEEPTLVTALERADLIVSADAGLRLEPRLLQPFHTLIEAAGETALSVALERAGAQVIPHREIRAHHLGAQLEFVTGWKFDWRALVF
jgi:shikimate 5-dehydrogenase